MQKGFSSHLSDRTGQEGLDRMRERERVASSDGCWPNTCGMKGRGEGKGEREGRQAGGQSGQHLGIPGQKMAHGAKVEAVRIRIEESWIRHGRPSASVRLCT